MKKLLYLFFLLSHVAYTQNFSLSGKVIGFGDKEPVVGASVFINNTTRGTITNVKGEFTLGQLSAGKYDLVVSIIGYEKQVTTIDIPTDKPLNISIREKANVLQEVVVTPFEKDGWAKWGRVFLETFIGTTSNGERTKLKNTKDLRFRYHKDERVLEVVAMKPLMVENKALGYDLEYHLEGFYIDYKTNISTYLGYPFMKDHKSPSKKQIKNREDSYNASLTKFLKSLYNNTVIEEGYVIRRMEKRINKEKARVRELQKKYSVIEYDENRRITRVNSPSYPPEVYTSDSLSYFSKVLSEPSEKMYLYTDTLKVPTLIKANSDGSKTLSFRDYLYVVNTKLLEDKKYLEFLRVNRQLAPQTSMLVFNGETEEVIIYENGHYYSPLDILTLDYWAWSNKVGDLLPMDYTPKSSTP